MTPEATISTLNPEFCELMAQYWVWKNADLRDSNMEFVHYQPLLLLYAPLVRLKQCLHTSLSSRSEAVTLAQSAEDMCELTRVLAQHRGGAHGSDEQETQGLVFPDQVAAARTDADSDSTFAVFAEHRIVRTRVLFPDTEAVDVSLHVVRVIRE